MIHRIGVRRALGALRLRAGQLLPEPVGETGNDLVLHVEKVGDRLVETFSPRDGCPVSASISCTLTRIRLPLRCTLPSST